MIASECVPFVKTGGLADVVGALPKALKSLGHEVKVILPKYSIVDADKYRLERFLPRMEVWMGDGKKEGCAVDRAYLDDEIPVYFIENWDFFKRDGIYNDTYKDYSDNPERFAFFTRAALQLCVDAGFETDIIHAHDWHTALAPAYLKTWPWKGTALEQTASVFTIHNIQYQGSFSKSCWPYTGISWQHFSSEKFEHHGGINYLKGGIAFADKVTTVSPTYAHETKHTQLGAGLNDSLRQKGQDYVGILNGVDYQEWNPKTDQLIPSHYDAKKLAGKKACKQSLQEKFELVVDPEIPLIGVVSRLANQKGLDVLFTALQTLLKEVDFQFILLGSGDQNLETSYAHLAHQYLGKVGAYIGYNNTVAHEIEAGADFFVMPSRFEPCGLNQMYSLKYGTLPIVRNTGGLADTIEQYEQETGSGTGFKFDDLTPLAIINTIKWALDTWYQRKAHIDNMIQTAMKANFSWEQSAKRYVELYREALK